MTAFILDPDHVQSSEDGMTVPPLPGLWRNDVAILPGALGLTLAEMRDLVATLSLPLVETTVSDSAAVAEFPRPASLLPTESSIVAVNRLHGLEPPTQPEEPTTIDPENVDVTRAENEEADVIANPHPEAFE